MKNPLANTQQKVEK